MAQQAGYARVAYNFGLSSFRTGRDSDEGDPCMTLSGSLTPSNVISFRGVPNSHRTPHRTHYTPSMTLSGVGVVDKTFPRL